LNLSRWQERFLSGPVGQGAAGALIALASFGFAPPPPVLQDRPAITELSTGGPDKAPPFVLSE
jgi:hypothetical protein